MRTDREIRIFWRQEFALIGLLFLFFGGIVIFARRLPFDARLFPMVIGVTGLLLSAGIAAGEIRRWRSPQDAAAVLPRSDPAVGVEPRRYALALLSAPVFGLLLWLFGFFAASLAAMTAMPWLMGLRNWRLIGIVAVTTIAGLALIFPTLLGVNLPNGIVGDWLIDAMRAH